MVFCTIGFFVHLNPWLVYATPSIGNEIKVKWIPRDCQLKRLHYTTA